MAASPPPTASRGAPPTQCSASQRRSSSRRRWGRSGRRGCEMTYGFLPCTATAGGNLFLALAYGFLMFKAATYLSAGSELLLEILGPGIVGGLFLPILGALPDALLILVSGLSGTKEVAQSQVLIGMGLLAGSTVMLLTILWGSCVVVGKCDLTENSTAIDSRDKKCFSLFDLSAMDPEKKIRVFKTEACNVWTSEACPETCFWSPFS